MLTCSMLSPQPPSPLHAHCFLGWSHLVLGFRYQLNANDAHIYFSSPDLSSEPHAYLTSSFACLTGTSRFTCPKQNSSFLPVPSSTLKTCSFPKSFASQQMATISPSVQTSGNHPVFSFPFYPTSFPSAYSSHLCTLSGPHCHLSV